MFKSPFDSPFLPRPEAPFGNALPEIPGNPFSEFLKLTQPPRPSGPFGSNALPPLPALPDLDSIKASLPPSPSRVLVVHGRDLARTNEVALFLTNGGCDPIMLKDHSDADSNLLDEFIRIYELKKPRFAVVLATADDYGGLYGTVPRPRPRQNVIFEHGFMVAKLGKGKVAVLAAPGIEYPSDYSGRIYIPLDAPEGWRVKLADAIRKSIPSFNSKKAVGLKY